MNRFTITLPPLFALRALSWQSALLGLCLVLGYLDLMLVLQQPISVNAGQGWDGYYYYQMAAHADISGIYYAFRVRYGLPWLAGFFPTGDILFNFKLINMVCALLYSACCYVILVRCSANMHPAVPLIGWCLVCAGNLAPIPSVLWYPIQTDVVTSLFALIFLMMMITGRIHLLAIAVLFFAGTAVRDNFPEFLLFGLMRLHLSYDRNKTLMENIRLLVEKNHASIAVIRSGLLASLAGIYSIAFFTGGIPFEDRLWDLKYISGSYINNPVHLLAVITNSISAILFIVFASLWLPASVKYSGHLFGAPFTKLIIILLSLIAVLGGTNPERYWYWAMPFFVLCILPAINRLIENKYYLLLGLCMLWTLFIQRTLVPIDRDGIAKDCDFSAILSGHSNWIGHWANLCSPLSQQHLVTLASATGLVILLLAGLPQLRNTRLCKLFSP